MSTPAFIRSCLIGTAVAAVLGATGFSGISLGAAIVSEIRRRNRNGGDCRLVFSNSVKP
jgi:D-arabinose 5-phosphate isomerase GutQ